jgi:hypothetical protein
MNFKRIVLVIVIVVGVAYGVMTVYGNFIQKPAPTKVNPTMPDYQTAQYSVLIRTEGRILLTNNYEQIGDTVKQRTFILHNYWEQIGTAFIYRRGDMILPEKIFGQIDVKKRGVVTNVTPTATAKPTKTVTPTKTPTKSPVTDPTAR